MCVCYLSSDDSHWSKLWLGIKWREGIEQDRVLLKVVNPNVDVNVDVDVTFVNFAFY